MTVTAAPKQRRRPASATPTPAEQPQDPLTEQLQEKSPAQTEDTITFTTGGRSVTLTGEQFDRAAADARAGRGPWRSQPQERLIHYVKRVEVLREEMTALKADEKEVLAEAKLEGFDPKVIKDVIKYRAMDQSERDEYFTILNIYLRAVGIYEQLDLPFEDAA